MNNFFERFINTFNGCNTLIKKDYNFVIHLIIGVIVAITGLATGITSIEWLFIVTAIMFVLTTETINTAMETVVDLVTKQYHPLAKKAKDISAFAVLLSSIYAIIVGLIIFLPYWF